MNSKTKYSLLTYLFLLLTIFVVFIFSKDFYTQMIDNNEQLRLLNDSLNKKSEEYNQLSKIKSQIEAWTLKDVNFNKFLVKFSEDELLEYFYSYASNHLSSVKIEWLSLSQAKKNEFWFSESTINMVATFSTEQDMIDMINFLLKSEKYNLYIHDFTYPYGQQIVSPIKVTIPLKVLYK